MGRTSTRAVCLATAALALTAVVSACRPVRKRAPREEVRAISLQDPTPRRRAGAPLEADVEALPEPPPGFVHAKARFVWIRKRPDPDAEWIGYMTLGQSLALRRDPRGMVDGAGSICSKWAPVEPKGWVCLGRDATLDEADPTFQIMRSRTADISSPYPFDYARSLGAPRYRVLPSERDQRAREGDIAALLGKIGKARSAKGDVELAAIDRRLVGVELDLTGAPIPPMFEPAPTVMESDEDLSHGSTVAYVGEFDHDGRAWLLGWDHSIVPQVRVKKFPRSRFAGVELDAEIELPIAFVRRQGAYRYKRSAEGPPVITTETFDPHTMVDLTDGVVQVDGRKLFETTTPGEWVSERDVVYVNPTSAVPKEVSSLGRRTWLEVSTVGGWLVAYEGARPVYATAISAGRAGLKDDGTMIPSSSTPLGTYTIKSKLRTTTMRSDRRPNRSFAEVMYTQVFEGDYALHGAYWHEDFGERRSAGCVNLAPIDARWLFEWSEPRMFDGWHAKNTLAGEPTTVVVVHL